MKKIIVYLNQFFGQVGAEDKADIKPMFSEGPVGPALALEAQLKNAKITHTIICGDNYMASNTQEAIKEISSFLEDKEFDLLVAGPAFLAGRYGFACGEVCKNVAERFNVPTITSMNENNPGMELYRKDTYIVKGHNTAAGMRKDIAPIANLANKITNNEELFGADAEGYFSRGLRKEIEEQNNKTAADRAVDMLLKKLNGEVFETELFIEQEDKVEPLAAIQPKDTRVAFVTTSGLVPTGNPDRIPAGGSTHWAKYEIGSKNVLASGDYISVHGGYNVDFAAKNPMLMVPLDALKKHVSNENIKSLHPYYYVLVGNQTAKGDAVRMAKEIVEEVRKDGVEAVILGST